VILKEYIAHRGWTIHYSSAGIHIDSKVPHFHYHLLVTARTAVKHYRTGEIYSLNKYLKSLGEPVLNGHSIKLDNLKTEQLENEEPDHMEALNRFLRYPLKEDTPITAYCYNIDVKTLTITAVAQYQHIKEQKKKDEIKKVEDALRWNKICQHLDQQEIPKNDVYTTYRSYLSVLIDYTRQENPPVTTKILQTKTLQYLKYKQILSNEILMDIEENGIKYFRNNHSSTKITKDLQETLQICRQLDEQDRNHIFENHENGEKLKYLYNL